MRAFGWLVSMGSALGGKLKSVLALAWLLAAAGLASCGSDTPELPESVTRPVTIRIAAFQGPETTALFRIIPEWEHITGNTVELGIIDRETGERMVAGDYVTYREAVISNAEQGLGEYDVIIVDDPWMPYLATNNHLAPLAPFGYERDPDIVERSSSLGVWPPTFGPLPPDQEGIERGAETYALPLVGNVMMLWYRQDIIGKPETLDELRTNLDNPDPAYIGSAGLAPSTNPHVFLSWLASRGGDVFDRAWRPTPLRSSIAAEAFAEYIDEATRLGIPFDEYVDERYTPHARMLDGTAAAAVGWAADAQQILTSSVSDQLRVTLFPAGRRSSTITGNWLLAIPDDSAQPEAAYDFITWATSQDIMKTSALLGVPPARESLFNDRELVKRYSWLPEVEVALQNSFARPRIPAWDVVEGIIGCALDRGLIRAADVKSSAAPAVLDADSDASTDATGVSAINPVYVDIAQEELDRAATEIEGVMEEWGFYQGSGYYADHPGEHLLGDPRDEWTCEASS
ncbi:MAG: extracellular solute-binding protein [Dehalococcoidia bacterium]|nr:extracellular solute-binding protein [Dehalococcoidia bacterium]